MFQAFLSLMGPSVLQCFNPSGDLYMMNKIGKLKIFLKAERKKEEEETKH